MKLLIIFVFILFFIVVVLLSYANVKYFITMWKYKNRKKDGSEDKDFRMFD